MTDDRIPPDADDLDLLLIRHFTGRLSLEDQSRLDHWLAGHPARAEELERLRWVWAESAKEPMEVDADAALGRFKGWAERRERELARPAPRAPEFLAPRRSGRPRWVAAAAALFLAAGLGMVADRVLERASPDPSAEAPPHTFMTARGERARFRLPDGTAVMLGPSSSLQVPATFRSNTRDVRLAGLAFFEVTPDSARPFRVRGGGGTAQVLGTKFSARTDSASAAPLEVVVSEGRVALAHGDSADGLEPPRGPVLTSGDLGRLAPRGVIQVVRGVDLSRRLGWVEGRLDFDRVPLSAVLRELEAWFDVTFVVADPRLRSARITTTLRNDSLTEMLRLLEAALGAKAAMSGKTVTLTEVRGR